MRIVMMIFGAFLSLILALWLSSTEQILTNYLIIVCAIVLGMVLSEILFGQYGAE